MPLRKATYGDLSQVALVLSKAFYDDPLNEYFFPNRKLYPDDYLRAWTQELMISWLDYQRVWIVSCDGPEINGVACWARRGIGGKKLWNVHWWDPRQYLARIVAMTHVLPRMIYPNRAVRAPSASEPDPISKWSFGATMAPFISHHFSEPELSREHWELCTLAVHPDHQRRGIGGELVAWGMERVKAEDVPGIVVSSDGNEQFYQKQGFEVHIGCAGTEDRVVDGKTVLNPMKIRGVPGGHIFRTKG